MPHSKQQNLRLQLIDDLLVGGKRVKTSAIRQRIFDRLGQDISIRTIQNDISAMKNDADYGYFAPIEYEKAQHAFYYSDREYTIRRFPLHSEEIRALELYVSRLQILGSNRIFESVVSGIKKVIDVVKANNRLRPSSNAGMILQTEPHSEAPGIELLEAIAYAIEQRLPLMLCYKKFGFEEQSTKRVLPLLLKEYRQRWYMIAHVKDRGTSTYGLDRIVSVVADDSVYEEEVDFDAETFYRYSFGITTTSDQPLVIRLKFSPKSAPYVKTVPLHKTQKIIEDGDEGLIVQLEVLVAYELISCILGYGTEVEVLSPASLRADIGSRLLAASKKYF